MAIVPLRPYQSLTSIVFIDGSLPDSPIGGGTEGGGGLEAIHIISHGASGQVIL